VSNLQANVNAQLTARLRYGRQRSVTSTISRSVAMLVDPRARAEVGMLVDRLGEDRIRVPEELAYNKAIELAGNTAETAHLTRRRDQLG